MVYQVFRGKEALRDKTHKEQCKGKKQYRLREARQTVNTLHKMGRFKEARIYECPFGDHWHIARQR